MWYGQTGHADHKGHNVVKYIERGHAYKEVKPFQVASSDTFGRPGTMMVIVSDTYITRSTMVSFSLLISSTASAVSS